MLDHIGMIFKFIGGLGMFLYGMNLMADSLQKAAGSKAKKLLEVLTRNKFLGVIVGALITMIIQSSSATTVMVVGFVNARLMDLTQAVGVIMGANIGTTITSWIVSMNEWGTALNPEFFAPLVIGIGAFILLFAQKENKRDGATIAIGFGILFVGLSFMSGAIKPYSDSPIFSQAFTILGKNPILGILTGAIVTGIIQSSSASVGILQTLAMNGVVNWNSAIFITLGQNIGTCVTALISSVGANRNAKRASIIHLLFNTIGAVIFSIIMFVIFSFKPDFAASNINSIQISIFHTIFNITCTILLFPFTNQLVKLSTLIIKDDGSEEVEETDKIALLEEHLDKRLLNNPSFAIETAIGQSIEMGNLALHNTKKAINAFIDNDKKAIESVFRYEDIINNFQKMITEYLVLIDVQSVSEEQHGVVKNILYTISDLERISDHCENIAELAQSKIARDIPFSDEGIKDLKIISECTILTIENALRAMDDYSSDLLDTTLFYEEKVDTLEADLREKHIARLSDGICGTEGGILFLDVISNLERISDHALNVSQYSKPL